MSSKVVFTAEIEESPDVVVEKWDWNAVKNALDDSARKFLISQENFVEDHFLMNWRLIISTIAVVISLYGIVYDWLHPFPESKLVLIFCVGFYFVFIGILTAYTTFIEKGCFAAAKQNDDSATPNVWRLSSKQKKYEDIYSLEIEFIEGGTGKSRKETHETSVARYFDENGTLCTKIFHKHLCQYFTSLLESKKTK